VIGIAAGMEYLHSWGVAHHDLKPENVLLDKDWRPAIGDFGLARTLRTDRTATSCKTDRYLALEVHSHYYDLSVDVLSYGKLLYMMFCPSQTPKLDPADGPLQTVAGKARRRLYERLPGIGDFYWDLITECWDKDAASRPTFDQIVDRLVRDPRHVFEGTDEAELRGYEDELIAWRPPRRSIPLDVPPHRETARRLLPTAGSAHWREIEELRHRIRELECQLGAGISEKSESS
jgi:serine/threonine protein kinase